MYRNSIRIISDLHLERPWRINQYNIHVKKSVQTKYIALLGDIGDPKQKSYKNFLFEQADNYEKVFVIAGNHEYYFKTIEHANQMIDDICSTRSNLVFMNDKKVVHENINFIGTTLWSNLSANENSKDLTHIRGKNGKRIQSWIITNLHRRSVDFIENSICPTKKNIVLSHHAPSYQCLKRNNNFVYRNGDQVKEIFATPLEWLFPKGIDYWCYGHTHIPQYILIGNTRVCSNPLTRGFNINFAINLD